MKIGMASDHAGYLLKNKLISFLKNQNYKIHDFGCFTEESVDYPDFAHPLANAVESKTCEFGISICGSGNGINMTANKHQKIRAALCWSVEIAVLARLHNDANICSLPARFISEELAVEILKAFLSTKFEGGRHQKRIDKIPL